MSGMLKALGTSVKASVAVLALGALAVPMAGALAVPGDPTQAEPVADAATMQPAADSALTADQMAASKALFGQYSCGACHVLTEAGGNGHIGPSLDGNANLDKDYIVGIVSNGQGAMPSFGGMIVGDDIDQLAAYIMQVKK